MAIKVTEKGFEMFQILKDEKHSEGLNVNEIAEIAGVTRSSAQGVITGLKKQGIIGSSTKIYTELVDGVENTKNLMCYMVTELGREATVEVKETAKKGALTDLQRGILDTLKDNEDGMLAKEVGEVLNKTAKSVTGSLLSLAKKGFVTKEKVMVQDVDSKGNKVAKQLTKYTHIG